MRAQTRPLTLSVVRATVAPVSRRLGKAIQALRLEKVYVVSTVELVPFTPRAALGK
jgi:hypothetical protein